MECPYCRSRNFYLKDPQDEYETYEFDLREGEIEFLDNDGPAPPIPVEEDTPVFCNRCAWHGKMGDLKK
ncbi:MAG: hypothetical protein HXY45_04080 [Syntrophaceae bacterium]|jgi:hypothetical protein|nr:hypothetical protein [Syntrophaceae bacterium]